MLPAFVELPGAPFAVLPPGIHWATMHEIKVRFAITPRRLWLWGGIEAVVAALRIAECQTMYLDGSYVTAKEEPEDFDGCWDPRGVAVSRLDPVLLDFSDGRKSQKAKYRGEMFIATTPGGIGGTFLDFFQTEEVTGARKGIVGLRLVTEG